MTGLVTKVSMGFRFANITSPGKLIPFCLLLLIASLTFQTPAFSASRLPGSSVPKQDLVLPEKDDSPWLKLWRQAREMTRQGDLAGAVVVYQELLSRRPHVDEARWELVQIYIEQNQLAQAIGLMEDLLETNPQNIKYLNLLARLMQQQDQFDRALDLLGRALAVDPENYLSLAGMAAIFHRLGRQQEELVYLDKLAKVDDLDLGLKEQLAYGFFELELFEKARPLATELATAAQASMSSLLLAARVHGALSLDNPAAGYWQQVLDRDSSLVEAHRWLAKYFEKQGRGQEALVHYLFLYGQFPEDSINLLKIAQIHAASAKYNEALIYLQKYLSKHPFDREGIRCLVNIQASLGNQAQTLAALDRYFAVEPDPSPDKLRQAARLYDAAGRYHDAIVLYRQLLKVNPLDPDLLATLAEDLLAIGEDDSALRVLTVMASVAPGDREIFLGMVGLLESLGRHGELGRLLADRHKRVPDDHEVTLRLIQSLLDRGERDEATAMVAEVFDLALLSPVLLELRAVILQDLGMTARALADYDNILSQLPDHLKARKNAIKLNAALGHLGNLQRHAGLLTGAGLSGAEFSGRELANILLDHLVESYAAAKIDYHQVVELAESFVVAGDNWFALVLYQMVISDESLASARRCELKLAMAEIRYAQGLLFEGEQILRGAWLAGCRQGRAGQQFASLMEMEEDIASDHAPDHYLLWPLPSSLSAQDPAGLIELAQLAEKNGRLSLMATFAFAAYNQVPDSLSAGLLLVRAHELQGDLEKAGLLLEDLLARYPGMLSLIDRLAVITFQQGNWGKAMTCAGQVLAIDPSRQDMHRLRARIMWRQGRGEEAVKMYNSLLDPPVLELANNLARKRAVALPLGNFDSSWNFISSESDDPLAGLMGIDFFNDLGKRKFNEIILPLYANYRWQQEFTLELASRQAILGREYRRALYYLNLLLKRQPADPFLLFDLAEVYDHLYRLDDAALLYARIHEINADYPGLEEAWSQNRQRRRPSIALSASLAREDRRDGYKAMEQRAVSLTGRIAPGPKDNLSIDLQRIHFLSIDGDESMWASRFMVGWQTSFLDHFDLSLGTGMEHLEDDGQQITLVDCRLKGQLGDIFSGELLLRRDVVSDTMASLQRNIVAEDIELSLAMGLSSYFALGADYGLTSFSDDNDLSRYSFWASYLLVDQEPAHLEFSLSYVYKDADEGARPGLPLLADGFAADDHPYWAPVDYWQTSLGVSWHYLLGHGSEEYGSGDYYALGYRFNYDCTGRDQHVLSGALNWQLNKDFVVKTDLEYITSDDYRASDVTLSLVYRW